MSSELETAFAKEWPHVVGAILRAFGSVDVAEESDWRQAVLAYNRSQQYLNDVIRYSTGYARAAAAN